MINLEKLIGPWNEAKIDYKPIKECALPEGKKYHHITVGYNLLTSQEVRQLRLNDLERSWFE
ncbi:MAG TPA: hypothetical protein VJB13_01040 [Candidatus Nanoarchaeia archaeon]|nr:hypothetical protein [Candidatus Nanoarchaeia archaeon]